MSFFRFRKVRDSQTRDFSLASGERQTALSIEGVRKDHIYRYEACIDWLIKSSPNVSGYLGVDLFCATGYGARLVSETLGCHILGIDASDQAINIANKHFSTTRTFYCTKRFPFSLPKRVFDFATCIESVEHVAEYDLLIKSVLESLKPQGILFLSTPNEDRLPFDGKEMPFHVRHFHHKEILELVNSPSNSKLITYFGQNVYDLKAGESLTELNEEEMILEEAADGQFQLYVFQKNKLD